MTEIDPAGNANYQPTSRAAAIAMRGRTSELQARVLEALQRCEVRGAINEQLAEMTGIRLDTVKPRANELWRMSKIALLKDDRRVSSAGASCQVWIANDWICSRSTREPRKNSWKTRALKAEAQVDAYRDLYGELLFPP